MRLLGLDFGTKRIGVALSEEMGWSARGLSVIQRKGGKKDLNAVANLVEQHEIDEIVVGLPLNMDGSEGRMARLSRTFAEQLEQLTGLKVHLWDERLSSFEAEEVLKKTELKSKKRRQLVDQVAAALILESFMEGRAAETEAERKPS